MASVGTERQAEPFAVTAQAAAKRRTPRHGRGGHLAISSQQIGAIGGNLAGGIDRQRPLPAVRLRRTARSLPTESLSKWRLLGIREIVVERHHQPLCGDVADEGMVENDEIVGGKHVVDRAFAELVEAAAIPDRSRGRDAARDRQRRWHPAVPSTAGDPTPSRAKSPSGTFPPASGLHPLTASIGSVFLPEQVIFFYAKSKRSLDANCTPQPLQASSKRLHRAHDAAQFRQPLQPADQRVAGIDPLLADVVGEQMAVIRPHRDAPVGCGPPCGGAIPPSSAPA